jgi:peptide-methionine (S)-S-oxide reductase
VTEVTDAPEFFPAESYHQAYFATNPNQGYCAIVINPKVAAFKREFSTLLKNSDQ